MNMLPCKAIVPCCLLLLAALLLQSCFTVSQRDVREVPVGVPAAVGGEAKVHTYSGEVILYPYGFRMSDSLIMGEGRLYSLDRRSSVPISSYQVDSVLAIERVSNEADMVSTVAAGVTVVSMVLSLLVVTALAGWLISD
jgi:hypothetical protein